LTGTPEGKIAHVGYLGDIEQLLGREALLRVSPFEKEKSSMQGVEIPASVLTTSVPQCFNACDSNSAVLYYIWDSIETAIKVPSNKDIYGRFPIGFTSLSLYIGEIARFSVSFFIGGNFESEVESEVVTAKDENGLLNGGILRLDEFMQDPKKYTQYHIANQLHLKGTKRSMYRYLERMSNKNPNNQLPRLIGIEQAVNFDALVRPFFEQILKESAFGIKWVIPLEEQV
jgi:hypothetical protein